MIEKYLNKYHLSANALEIEITEGALQDTKETISILNDLKDIGIKISIDDFGTGYSSLSYLKQFPLDVLKIDQSFVKEMLYDKRDSAIIKTIVHLAHNLNLEVVAEGVETKEQAEFLRNVQCQKAQGYYFSKPLEAKQIEDRFLTAKPILF
jgi:EAL domain-containing protein (putative c-di-GMP-specific phosphodiesterase class I)